jgi:type II secretory pathway pseudopilin PulG
MKKSTKHAKTSKGFTLLEILVAMGVIISVLTSALILITLSVSSTKTTRMKIIAISLSQEGLEIVRNIRDNNWLAGKRTPFNWRDGIGSDLGPTNYRVQYDSSALLPFSTVPLKLSNNFYQYASGENTLFYRKIIIERIGANQIKVVSEVTWTEGGRNNIISAETRLYNWLEES